MLLKDKKRKVMTFSYDDGNTQDTISIFQCIMHKNEEEERYNNIS